MSGRTYLSIGDVLTLLREEFPDVTISKIRFLESQGLVNPERSPSGYRKFFEPDVERLRWVLRQQREHFLPLKVIRDRLAAGDLSDLDAPTADAVDDAAHTQETHARTVPQPAGVGAAATSAQHANSHGGSGAAMSRTEAQLAQADNEAMARIVADAERDTPRARRRARMIAHRCTSLVRRRGPTITSMPRCPPDTRATIRPPRPRRPRRQARVTSRARPSRTRRLWRARVRTTRRPLPNAKPNPHRAPQARRRRTRDGVRIKQHRLRRPHRRRQWPTW